MFDTYEHLQDNYIPNNINPCPPKKCNDEKLDPCIIKKPYEDYNIEGEVVGYWWYYKDILNLEFNITGDVVVEDNAIVYTAIGEKPTTETIGEIDQKAYNVVDLLSWTCTAIDGDKYHWTEDVEFDNPEAGDRNIYITAEDFMKDKQVTVQLYNFRHEPLVLKTYAGSTKIIFAIDKEMSEQLVKGVYYCTLTIWSGDTFNKTIFEQTDCTLTVK